MKYGVMLKTYDGRIFNMWIYSNNSRLESNDKSDSVLIKTREEYSFNNPKGIYSIEEINEEDFDV